MKKLLMLTVVGLLIASAVGCSSCNRWWRWGRSSSTPDCNSCGTTPDTVIGPPIYDSALPPVIASPGPGS